MRKGVKIASIKDLAGKKVAVDGVGAGARFTIKALLAAYGVKSTAVQMRVLDLATALVALKAETIDAMFLVSGAPVLALQDLSRSTSFDIVPIDGPTAVKLTQAFPFYSIGKIPANTYGTHPEIATVDVGTVLVSRDDFSDDTGFGIARALWHERNQGAV